MLPLLAAGGMMLGGAVASGIGSYLGGREARKSAQAQQDIYKQAYGMMPSELAGGLESVRTGYDPYASALSPQQSMFGQQMWGQALSPEMGGLSPAQQAQLTQMQGLAQGAFGAARPVSQFQAPTFDVAGAAQKEYEMLQQLLQPGQERARTAAEETLFARGMLGSTGGAQQLGELQKAQEMQNLAAAQQAIGSARASQAQQYGQALSKYQADVARQQQMFGQGMLAAGQAGSLAEQARALGSPERRMAMQAQAANLGMTIDQYEQAVQNQQFNQAMSAQQAYQNMMGARAGMFAGQAPSAGQAAMSPGMLALGGGLTGLGQGVGQFAGASMANPSMYGGGMMGSPAWMQNQGFMAVPGTM